MKVNLVQMSDPIPAVIDWTHNGWNEFEIYTSASPGDGHCLLHSVLNAFHIGYQSGIVNGKNMSRFDIVSKLRDEIATWLEMTDINGVTNYELIANGNLVLLGKETDDYTLNGIKKLLNSSKSLGQESVIILEHFLNKKIFILDSETADVYRSGFTTDKKDCVVIFYRHGKGISSHFDSVFYKNRITMTDDYHFDSLHPFTSFLYERLNSV